MVPPEFGHSTPALLSRNEGDGEAYSVRLRGSGATLDTGKAEPCTGRLLSWVTWRRYRDKGTDLQYEFFENEFTVHSSDADSRYNYSVIQDIVEGPDHYLLVVDINMAHVLNKKSFLAGDSNAFGPWISQKTGKKMIRMH